MGCFSFLKSFHKPRIKYTGRKQKSKCLTDSNDVINGDVSEEVKEKWQKEVEKLKQKLVLEDPDCIQEMLALPVDSYQTPDRQHYVAGVDISFVKGDLVNACAALVVLSYPQLEVVYKDLHLVKLTAPYIPGYLGFRESGFAVEMMNTLRESQPELIPDVIMVDGNGILHVHDFGSACHIGVALDMPCIGVAKNLFHTQGIEKNDQHKAQIASLVNSGDTFELVAENGKTLGLALLTGDKSVNPVYVSPGNHVSMESAARLVHRCSKHRIPEPIRQADMQSREYLRNNFSTKDEVT